VFCKRNSCEVQITAVLRCLHLRFPLLRIAVASLNPRQWKWHAEVNHQTSPLSSKLQFVTVCTSCHDWSSVMLIGILSSSQLLAARYLTHTHIRTHRKFIFLQATLEMLGMAWHEAQPAAREWGGLPAT
jgi:hypothetical protein